ncbi:MAG: type II toxin-antitoxin system Phd/YefM family antitoxin [Spirochaetales bacterium]|nr:type II toxin-antitoxin system Phd/YefM family antitoxin [Spirochaetales bacterium]
MTITATELKENLGYYLGFVAKESVCITKNGKAVAVLTSPAFQKLEALNSLIGIIPDDGKTADDYRAQRLAEYL